MRLKKRLVGDWYSLADVIGSLYNRSKLKNRQMGVSILQGIFCGLIVHLWPSNTPLVIMYMLIVLVNMNYSTYLSMVKYPPKER